MKSVWFRIPYSVGDYKSWSKRKMKLFTKMESKWSKKKIKTRKEMAYSLLIHCSSNLGILVQKTRNTTNCFRIHKLQKKRNKGRSKKLIFKCRTLTKSSLMKSSSKMTQGIFMIISETSGSIFIFETY